MALRPARASGKGGDPPAGPPPAAGPRPRILIVEDEAGLRDALAALCADLGWEAEGAATGGAALERLSRRPFDLVILDERMPGLKGREVLRRIRAQARWTPVLFVTAYGDDALFSDLVELRCDGYSGKPFDLRALADKAREILARQAEAPAPVAGPPPQPVPGLVGRSAAMAVVYDQVRRFARYDLTLLVTGETGVGKERVARALHALSPRAGRPFVAVNCANLDTLVESELFGHTAGAFTDAKRARPGLFVEAAGGTVFLDEITELPGSVQAKLLRALQEREIRPVGGDRPLPIDVRFVAACNVDVQQAVRAGRLREDLYYRVADGTIHVPPLRDRLEDLPELAAHLLEALVKERGMEVRGLDPRALRKLMAYRWPGNVRQLESVLKRAAALARGPVIDARDLELPPDPSAELHRTLAEVVHAAARAHLLEVLRATGWAKGRAAAWLGIPRSTLNRKIRHYRLDEEG